MTTDMTEFRRVVESVREVLAHFHDRGYLLSHPLTAQLTVGPTDAQRIEQLRRTLMEAITALRDEPGARPGSQLWRGYRLLVLRYLEGASTSQITRELGVTDRQARRDQQHALEVLAEMLRERHRQLHGADRSPAEPADPELETAFRDEEALLEAELLRLGAARAEGATDVGSVIASVVATIAPLASRRSVQVRTNVPRRVPPVATNRTTLRQICLTLLTYAIERTTGPTIEVDAVAEQHEAASHAVLRIVYPVASSSMALAPEDDPRLLVPRRLARLQGGTLRVDQQVSTQELRLTLPGVSLATVLVIDDDPDVVRLFRRLLAGQPYDVLGANTGTRALQLVRQIRPILVLLDVMMPSEDGWEILHQIQGDPDLRQTPVVVCSVLRERELAEALGAAEFLPKPVSRPALLAVLERYRPAS